MKPYQTPESKKEQVKAMFDTIAPRYDLLNRVLSLGIDRSWRKKMVRAVAKASPAAVLDMATGTGDLALMLAKQMPQAQITGVDLSPQMLKVARTKIEQAGLTERITLCTGEAEMAEYGTEQFDAATVAFGVRNFENIEQGIFQLYNALKPNGELFVLEFGIPNSKIFGNIYRFYFHRILPLIGGLISRDRAAYTYLPESVDEFPSGEAFAKIMTGCGFSAVKITELMGGVAQIYYGKKADTKN